MEKTYYMYLFILLTFLFHGVSGTIVSGITDCKFKLRICGIRDESFITRWEWGCVGRFRGIGIF